MKSWFVYVERGEWKKKRAKSKEGKIEGKKSENVKKRENRNSWDPSILFG